MAASAPAGAASSANAVFLGTPIRGVYVRLPRAAATSDKPLQVLVALHGMGGNGEDFARDLIEPADRYGWLIVAPTIAYGDYMNPNVVAQEDPVLIRALSNYLDQLPQTTGMNIRRRILLLGHSRGAQLAHRFAEFQPDRVLAVAALSAGSYTMPSSVGAFPYGIKDLANYAGRAFDRTSFDAIQFWVGVGGQDNNASDVPRQWDVYEGKTRVQRAEAFESAMQQLGATSVLRVFSDAKHDLTGDMRTAACTFLQRALQPRAPFGAPLTASPESI